MTVNKSNPSVEVAYKSIDGTVIYTLKDRTKISAFRGVAAEKAKRFASLCITETELNKLLDTAIEAVNKRQDIVTAIAILSELKFRNSMICEENSLLELAYIFLMLEGEDVDHPSPEFNRKKADLISKEPDLHAFFLQQALSLVDGFSQKPGADLLAYLQETKGLIEKMSRHISPQI